MDPKVGELSLVMGVAIAFYIAVFINGKTIIYPNIILSLVSENIYRFFCYVLLICLVFKNPPVGLALLLLYVFVDADVTYVVQARSRRPDM